MAINSRRKGKAGELELAKWLQERGYDARRGQQYSGANGDADVVGIPGIHIECKRVETQYINAWLAQAENDAAAEAMEKHEEIKPVVFHRQNHSKKDSIKGRWKVTMFADDFIEILKRGEG